LVAKHSQHGFAGVLGGYLSAVIALLCTNGAVHGPAKFSSNFSEYLVMLYIGLCFGVLLLKGIFMVWKN
jgi:hypothetical protein